MTATQGAESGPADLYATLGVARDADAKAIKEAFRTLTLKYHPDRNKEPGAEEKFKQIAAAYSVLSDPEKRQAYDTGGFTRATGLSEKEFLSRMNIDDLLGAMGIDLGDLGLDAAGFGNWGLGGRRGGPFSRWFGSAPASPRGADLEVDIEIELDRIANGGEQLVRFPRRVLCASCQGTGAKQGTAQHACAACGGTGKTTQEQRQQRQGHEISIRNIETCAQCQGRGSIIDQPCSECGGRGRIEKEETLTVNVPIGAEDGMALRIPGHGEPSQQPSGRPGDLLLVLRSARDARFERHGADLWSREVLSVAEAALGTTRDIPILHGRLELTIPAGTQPGVVLRVAGKGLPRWGGGGSGDRYVRLDVSIPEQLSPRQRELYSELWALERAAPGIRSAQVGS